MSNARVRLLCDTIRVSTWTTCQHGKLNVVSRFLRISVIEKIGIISLHSQSMNIYEVFFQSMKNKADFIFFIRLRVLDRITSGVIKMIKVTRAETSGVRSLFRIWKCRLERSSSFSKLSSRSSLSVFASRYGCCTDRINCLKIAV